MSGTLRKVEGVFDAYLGQVLTELLCSEILLAASAHKEGVNLGIEGLGIRESPVIKFGEISARSHEYGAAESSQMGEFVQIPQSYLEGLVSAPGKACKRAAVPVRPDPESLLYERNDVIEEHRSERSAESVTPSFFLAPKM